MKPLSTPHRFLARALFAGALGLSSASAVTVAPTTAQAAKDYTYVKTKIVLLEHRNNGTQITVGRGAAHGIYVGSTGLIYVGDSAEFLTDGKQQIRFRVEQVRDNVSVAHVFQGKLDMSILGKNRRVVLRGRKGGTSSPRGRPSAGSPSEAPGTIDGIRISSSVVARIRQYDSIIERVAKDTGVEAHLLRAVIAAESGGNPKLVSKSGWKGLMQAGQTDREFDPETSVRSGANKYKDMERWLGIRMKRLDLDLDSLSAAERLDAIQASFNAGQATVAQAMAYAKQAGNFRRWSEVQFYSKAVIYTGAYSAKQAATSCEKDPVGRAQKVNRAEAERRKFKQKHLSMEQARAAGASELMICAARFKAEHAPRYRAKINAYRKFFANQK